MIWVGRRTWVTSWKYAGVRRIKGIGEVEEIKERQRGSTKVNAGQLKSTAVKRRLDVDKEGHRVENDRESIEVDKGQREENSRSAPKK